MKRNLLLVYLLLLFAFTAMGQSQMPASRWAELDSNKVHYYDIGNAKAKNALVFVHGWTCSADFWKESFAAFPDDRVIALDLPGHGKSDKPKIDYTMEHFARAVDAVMKQANVKKAVLVGHSMGTPVIRQFYRLYPEKTLGLVIVDGAMRPYASKEDFEKFFAPIRADYDNNAHIFIEGMLTPIKDSALKGWIRRSMLSTPSHVALSAMEGMTDMKIWETDKINVPVLAWMAQSPFWKPDEEQYFRSIAPNLEFTMWSGVSHFLMMEQPALFNGQVKGFIIRNKLL